MAGMVPIRVSDGAIFGGQVELTWILNRPADVNVGLIEPGGDSAAFDCLDTCV